MEKENFWLDVAHHYLVIQNYADYIFEHCAEMVAEEYWSNLDHLVELCTKFEEFLL